MACSVQIYFIDSIVPVGMLTPSDIKVAVLMTDCPGGNVIVSTSHTGQSAPTPVPAVGGASITLPVTKPTECDDRIHVEAWCASDPTCRDDKDLTLGCPGCGRASVSATFGTCTGTPPVQPVTLSAQIGLQAGQTATFQWDHGDGTYGMQFTLTNTTTTAKTILTHVEPPHNYSPGAYTAKLRFVPPGECPVFEIPLTISCPATCPTAASAAWADKGCVAVQGVGKKRRIELSVTVTPPAVPASAQWIVRRDLGGGSFGPPIYGATFGCPPPVAAPGVQVPPGPQTFDLDAGDYEATLSFQYPHQTCPGLTLPFTAPTCPPDCPTLTLAVPSIVGCAPTNAVATFNATLSWAYGQVPSPIDFYSWTIDWTDQSVSPPQTKQAQNSTLGPTLTPSIATSDSGWTGSGVVGGKVDLSKPGSYGVTLQAVALSGGFPSTTCNPTQNRQFTVPGCQCPQPLVSGTQWTVIGSTAPLGPNKFEMITCGSAPSQITAFVDPGSYAPADLTYDWSFPDGTSVVGGSNTQPYTFTNTTQTVTQTHTVSVTVRVPGSSCAPFTRTVDVTVPGCTAGVPPTVKSCSVTGGSGTGSVAVTFDQDIDKASAEDPSNYQISIAGAAATTPAAGSISYDSASKTATISGLTINPGDSVSVTVTGVKGTTGSVMTTPGQTSCTAPKKNGNGGFDICSALLWGAIILMAIGAILVLLGCVLAKVAPQVSGVLMFIGWIAFGVGWLLFLLWLLFCRLTTACQVILAVRAVVGWLIVIFGVITAIIALFALGDPSLWICAGFGVIFSFNWGFVYWILDQIAQFRGCLIENPSGGS